LKTNAEREAEAVLGFEERRLARNPLPVPRLKKAA
jgi:hypothetical protein